MELHDYNKYYDEVISSYISSIKDLDEYNCLKPIRKKSKRKIYTYYQKKRDELIRIYMKKPVTALDRHKVASCMAYAILKEKVIRVNKMKPDLPDHLLMANEFLAFTIALNIIELYKYNDNMDENNFEYSIIVPKTYHENDNGNIIFPTFIRNICKYFYYIQRIKYYDVFAYSTVFFQLEKYTDTIIKTDQKIEKLKNKNELLK